MTAARRRAAVGGGYGAEYFGIRSERSRRALSVRWGWGVGEGWGVGGGEKRGSRGPVGAISSVAERANWEVRSLICSAAPVASSINSLVCAHVCECARAHVGLRRLSVLYFYPNCLRPS